MSLKAVSISINNSSIVSMPGVHSKDNTMTMVKIAQKAVSSANTRPATAMPKTSLGPVVRSSPLPSVVLQALGKPTSNDERSAMEKTLNDLQSTYNKPMPKPGPKKGDDKVAIVWRGESGERLVKMMKTQTAGGSPANRETGCPSEKEIQDQVGEKGRLPEFTFRPDVAEGFGTGSFVAAFEIETRYLAQGSVSEAGVVCNTDAPVKLVGWKNGRPVEAAVASGNPSPKNQPKMPVVD